MPEGGISGTGTNTPLRSGFPMVFEGVAQFVVASGRGCRSADRYAPRVVALRSQWSRCRAMIMRFSCSGSRSSVGGGRSSSSAARARAGPAGGSGSGSGGALGCDRQFDTVGPIRCERTSIAPGRAGAGGASCRAATGRRWHPATGRSPATGGCAAARPDARACTRRRAVRRGGGAALLDVEANGAAGHAGLVAELFEDNFIWTPLVSQMVFYNFPSVKALFVVLR